MGVFTTTKTYRLGVNLMPQWWLSGASIDLDFDNARYYDSSLATGVQSLAPLNSYLSISRASTGYANTAAGALTSFGNDTLRLTDLGLLVEDARTNLKKRSQDMTDAGEWGSNNAVTINATATTAPDGTTTGNSLIPNTSNTEHRAAGGGMVITAGAKRVSASAYFKSAGYNYGVLLLGDGAASVQYAVIADLVNGTITDTENLAGTPNGTNSIEVLANGWVRVSITLDHPGSGTAEIRLIAYNNATMVTNFNFVGNGTSGIYVWGAQVEEGAFASSYVPTTGASATRAADAITITGTAQTLINASTATIVARLGNAPGSSFAANVVDNNGTNLLGFNSSNNAIASITSTLTTANTANRSATTDDELGLAWSGAGRSLCLNGGTVATDAVAQTPASTKRLGGSAATNFIYSYVERLTIWNSKLADATLQSLTAP